MAHTCLCYVGRASHVKCCRLTRQFTPTHVQVATGDEPLSHHPSLIQKITMVRTGVRTVTQRWQQTAGMMS